MNCELFSIFALKNSEEVCRLVAGSLGSERKVRATKGNLLLNGKWSDTAREMQKKTTAAIGRFATLTMR